MMEHYYVTPNVLADILGVSRATLTAWERKKVMAPELHHSRAKVYDLRKLMDFSEVKAMQESTWEEELKTKPREPLKSIELFAGAGGLALGLEEAGFQHILLNEVDLDASNTLRANRPEWNVVCQDVHTLSFEAYKGEVDLVSGGFPCQAFSYAGKKGGFEDARGTLFFELARAVKEVQPKVLLGENVKGLSSHDGGKTLKVIRNVIDDLGYHLIEPRVLKAIFYKVPQKRERLFLIAFRKDLYDENRPFKWPSPYKRVMTLRDAFYKGELYPSDVPPSEGQTYPTRKREILDLVPMGGDWRDLPLEVQKEYLGASFFSGGGKTGMARRLSLDEPSLTLTCAPAQKQTERCHPLETRPLTIREYARIQTFPDEWHFTGSLGSQYKQIGNAVPVNLAAAVGRAVVRYLNQW